MAAQLSCCPTRSCCLCGTAILPASLVGFLSLQLGAANPGTRPRCAAPKFSASRLQRHRLGRPYSRLRSASSAATRAWQSTGLTLAQSVLGAGSGVATAAELLGQALGPCTAASYQRFWVLFERFCVSTHHSALTVSRATVCAYLGTMFEGLRLRGMSIRPYVAAIGTKHRRLALADPNLHTLVLISRRGFAAADARRRTGAPLHSDAYPAAAALHCLNAALSAPTSSQLQY
jgi:hypothetical protein